MVIITISFLILTCLGSGKLLSVSFVKRKKGGFVSRRSILVFCWSLKLVRKLGRELEKKLTRELVRKLCGEEIGASHLGSLEKTFPDCLDTLYPSHPLGLSLPGHPLVFLYCPDSLLCQLPVSRANLMQLGKETVDLCLYGYHGEPSPYLAHTQAQLLLTPRPAPLET